MNINEANKWFKIYYAQNREDLILKAMFHDIDTGFYVDIGAHDPEFFSVTKLFYDTGWRGINIEPQLAYYKKLKKSRTRDININVACGSASGDAVLRYYPKADGLSTLSENIKTDYVSDPDFQKVTEKFYDQKTKMLTLEEILDLYGGGNNINFLKIDVEGYEKEVLQGNNWAKYRPNVICIECNHETDEWHTLLDDVDYKLFFNDGLNEYYIDQSHYHEIAQRFNYSKGVLSQISINSVPFKLFSKELMKLSREVKKLNNLVSKQDEYIRLQDATLENIYHTTKSKPFEKLGRLIRRKNNE